MRHFLSFFLVLATPLGVYADAASRARVALALASAKNKCSVEEESAPPVSSIVAEEVPKPERWAWSYKGGDFAYLYLDGNYYATWSYSANDYVRMQATQPTRCARGR